MDVVTELRRFPQDFLIRFMEVVTELRRLPFKTSGEHFNSCLPSLVPFPALLAHL